MEEKLTRFWCERCDRIMYGLNPPSNCTNEIENELCNGKLHKVLVTREDGEPFPELYPERMFLIASDYFIFPDKTVISVLANK